MAFFKANQLPGTTGALAQSLTYQDFPYHFVLKSDEHNPQSKVWHRRQRQTPAIGRMLYVGPTAGERFYLRTLLMIVTGPQSFDDLKTVNGHLCETFHEACLRRGLLEDDGEWNLCLQEACEIQTGSQLRHLFTTLLLFCAPAQPEDLWNSFCAHICDDLHHQLSQLGRTTVTDNDVYDFGLHIIDDILHDSGHALSDFQSMPQPTYNWSHITSNRLISQQTNYDSNI
jgi:hypothetical protein